jgi:hypothetical protein
MEANIAPLLLRPVRRVAIAARTEQLRAVTDFFPTAFTLSAILDSESRIAGHHDSHCSAYPRLDHPARLSQFPGTAVARHEQVDAIATADTVMAATAQVMGFAPIHSSTTSACCRMRRRRFCMGRSMSASSTCATRPTAATAFLREPTRWRPAAYRWRLRALGRWRCCSGIGRSRCSSRTMRRACRLSREAAWEAADFRNGDSGLGGAGGADGGGVPDVPSRKQNSRCQRRAVICDDLRGRGGQAPKGPLIRFHIVEKPIHSFRIVTAE